MDAATCEQSSDIEQSPVTDSGVSSTCHSEYASKMVIGVDTEKRGEGDWYDSSTTDEKLRQRDRTKESSGHSS